METELLGGRLDLLGVFFLANAVSDAPDIVLVFALQWQREKQIIFTKRTQG